MDGTIQTIDMTTYPETFGPQDDDPLHALFLLLQRNLPPKQAYGLRWDDPPKNEEARKEVMSAVIRLRDARDGRAASKLATEAIRECIPEKGFAWNNVSHSHTCVLRADGGDSA